MKPTTIRFTSEDLAILARLCERLGLGQSQVIRLALRLLDKQGLLATKERKP